MPELAKTSAWTNPTIKTSTEIVKAKQYVGVILIDLVWYCGTVKLKTV